MANYFELPMRLIPTDEETPFMMDGQYWLLSQSVARPWISHIIRLIPSDNGRTPWDFDYESEREVGVTDWGRIVTVFMNEDCTDVDVDHMWDDVDPYWDEDRDEDEIVFIDPDEYSPEAWAGWAQQDAIDMRRRER